MKIKGPIATLGAVAVLGTGIWLVNVTSPPESQPTAATVTSAPPAAPVAPLTPPKPTAAPFAAREDFVATIAIKYGDLPLEIRVTGTTARAYACDNKNIEKWLSGTAINGELKLDSADKSSHLEGRHVGNTVVGNLRIGEMNWDFTARPGETSAF